MKHNIFSKEEKISEKSFSQGFFISILSIFLCIVALCSITYAWFNGSVQSNKNNIQSGHFSVDVTSVIPVVSDDATTASAISPDENGVYRLASGTYTVTLTPTDQTNVKGYCMVTINGVQYPTDVIVNESTVSDAYPNSNSPFTFQIVLAEDSTLVVNSRWGVPASPQISKDGTLSIQASSTQGEPEEATAE